MNNRLRAMILGGLLLFWAGTASAIPLPDFILYGQAKDGMQVAAHWNDKEISSAIAQDGYFKLVIPMDTESAFNKSGAVIELWVNGQPTGQMESIGEIGAARKISLGSR